MAKNVFTPYCAGKDGQIITSVYGASTGRKDLTLGASDRTDPRQPLIEWNGKQFLI